MLFFTNFTTHEQGYLKYENGCIVDLFEKDHPYIYTRCTPEQEQFVRRAGLYGMWRNIDEETGKTPEQELPYDKHIETYCFNYDGTGFFESLYYNGDLLVETECDRNSSGKFTYEWVKDTEITCTDFESGEQWKVTYIRGVFTDWEDPDDPVTYTNSAHHVSLHVWSIGTPTGIKASERKGPNEFMRYDLSGRAIKNPSRGINIIQWMMVQPKRF